MRDLMYDGVSAWSARIEGATVAPLGGRRLLGMAGELAAGTRAAAAPPALGLVRGAALDQSISAAIPKPLFGHAAARRLGLGERWWDNPVLPTVRISKALLGMAGELAAGTRAAAAPPALGLVRGAALDQSISAAIPKPLFGHAAARRLGLGERWWDNPVLPTVRISKASPAEAPATKDQMRRFIVCQTMNATDDEALAAIRCYIVRNRLTGGDAGTCT